MEKYYSRKIMVLDTEYETNPKRLLSLAYFLYSFEDNKWNKTGSVYYVKYDPEIFVVDENSEAFKYHKLTNDFLQKNGQSLNSIMMAFYSSLSQIDVLVGQNVMQADIQLVRKESIGEGLWFGKIRERLKSIKIFDTMMAFRDKNPEERSSLDNIYNFLFEKPMKNHHDASYDCINTFKIFEKMVQDEYKFEEQEIEFCEDILDGLMKETKKCFICESKIPEGNNVYRFKNKNNLSKVGDRDFSICNNILKENDEICKKCLGNLEILITKNNKMLNLVKLKTYDSNINDFFEIIGSENTTVYLVSHFKDKDEIKKLGGKWDSKKRSWYFTYTPKNKDKINKFSKWIPEKNIEV